ncbi:unnamed protein product [Symbiodinium sp. CCMP2592]|nr:unnamed protein product [Symbiodinium sp. CCMP2592]
MDTVSGNERPHKHSKTDKRMRAPFAEPSGGGIGPRHRGQNRPARQDKEVALIKAMGRLVIRQETQLQVLKQNSSWTLYLKPGQSGAMPILFKTASTYREASKTKFMEAPLRAVLLSTLFQTLLACLQTMTTQPDQQAQAKTKGWLNAEGKWVYQHWDPENKVLKADDTRTAVTHQEVINHVTLLVTAVTGKDVISTGSMQRTVCRPTRSKSRLFSWKWDCGPRESTKSGQPSKPYRTRRPYSCAACNSRGTISRGARLRTACLRLSSSAPKCRRGEMFSTTVPVWPYSGCTPGLLCGAAGCDHQHSTTSQPS